MTSKWMEFAKKVFGSRAADKKDAYMIPEDKIDAIMNRVSQHEIWGRYLCRNCGVVYNFDGWKCAIGGPIGHDIKTFADARWYLNVNGTEPHECNEQTQGVGDCVGFRKKGTDEIIAQMPKGQGILDAIEQVREGRE